MSAQLAVRDLSVRFGGVDALSGVSIAFPPGKIIGIIGPNGSGKTTLLNAMCGFLAVSNGSVDARWSRTGRAASGPDRCCRRPADIPGVAAVSGMTCLRI